MKGFMAALAVMFAAASIAGAAPSRIITHYHWAAGQNINMVVENAAAAFMAQNPDVQVKIIFLPDDTRVDVIRTVLASGRPIDSFGLHNGESAEFLAADLVVPLVTSSFGKSSVEQVAAMWTAGAIDTGVTVRNGFMCNSKAGVFNFLVLLSMMEQLGLDWGSEEGLIASMERPLELVRGLKTYTDFVTASRIWDPALYDEDRSGFGTNKTGMFLTAGSRYFGLLSDFHVPRHDAVPFPYPRFPGGKDIGGVGYGYCVYVSRHAADPALTFRFLDTLASRPNDFIRLGYYQPRVKLSDGTQALDPSLARKYIPYYEQVFKPEFSKTAAWLHSTRGTEVIARVWAAITRVIYQGGSVDDSVSILQADIKALFYERLLRR